MKIPLEKIMFFISLMGKVKQDLRYLA